MASSTRDRLIAAATDHLEQCGLEGLTLREIARSCGVSHGAPARHFDGVAALLAAVAASSFDRLRAGVGAAVAEHPADQPLVRLRAAGRAYVAFAVEHPGAFELVFRPELVDRTDPEYLRASWAAYEQLAGLTADAQATGWLDHLPTPTLTGVLWAGVHGIAALWVQGSLPAATGAPDVDAFVEVFQTDLARLTPSHPDPRSSR